MLEKKEKLPVVAFTFSRDRCNGNADALVSLDLTTSTEKHEIDSFFQKSIQLLKGSDQSLPQVHVYLFNTMMPACTYVCIYIGFLCYDGLNDTCLHYNHSGPVFFFFECMSLVGCSTCAGCVDEGAP